jgi:hypothetical protein
MIVLLVMGNEEGGGEVCSIFPYSLSCVNVKSVVVLNSMEGVATAAPPAAQAVLVVPVELISSCAAFFN